jgi:hypothetical protein
MEVYCKESVELNNFSSHAFMALTGTTLYDRILVVSVIHYFADYWVMFNGSVLFGISGAIHLFPP